LIACSPDTPRVVDPGIYKEVFTLQEKVIEELLRDYEEKAALQVAPQVLDPLQQTVATVIQGFLNHPEMERKRAISAIEFLNAPMLRVQLSELKKIHKEYQQTQSIIELIAALEAMRNAYGSGTKSSKATELSSTPKLERADLRLICFDVLSSD